MDRLGTRPYAGSVEFGERVLGERVRATGRGQVQGLPQRLAGRTGLAGPAQRRAQRGQRSRVLEPGRAAGQDIDRLAQVACISPAAWRMSGSAPVRSPRRDSVKPDQRFTASAENSEPRRWAAALSPVLDTIAMVPPAGIAELHMDPHDPMPYVSGGQLTGKLDEAAIDAFVAAAGPGSGSALVSAEIRHLGGALGRPQAGQGSLGTLYCEYFPGGKSTR